MLIHAGAGGTGLLLIQITKLIGAEVFTTVGSAYEKAEIARAAGADQLLTLYRQVDFGEAVEAIEERDRSTWVTTESASPCSSRVSAC